jgi:hypothetical protein
MLAIEEQGLALEMQQSIAHMHMLFYQLNCRIDSKRKTQLNKNCIFIPSGS